MILRDGIVLLEFIDLVNDTCISKPAYDKAVRTGRVVVVQKGGNGHHALVEWHSMPDRYKELVRHRLGGDPEVLARDNRLAAHLRLEERDAQYLDGELPDGSRLGFAKAEKLKEAAKVLALLAAADDLRRKHGQEAVAKIYGMPAMQLKDCIVAYVKRMKATGKLAGLPGSFTRLEAKKREYIQAVAEGRPGASCLVHAGKGNSNAAKVAQKMQQDVLITLLARPQNISVQRSTEDYNLWARANGWAEITPGTVFRFKKKAANARPIILGARGAGAYNDEFGIVVHRDAPSTPGYMWVTDGDVYELYYQAEVRNAKGLLERKYWLRKTVAVVLDAHSAYPLGWAIGDQETSDLTKQAIKNAVDHTRELTGGYLVPWQMQSDRFSLKKMKAFYGSFAKYFTPPAVGNPRSKVIEGWFGLHHQQYVQPTYKNFGGHNVDRRYENQPNPDALDKEKLNFPDEQGVIEAINDCLMRHRADCAAAYLSGLAKAAPGQLKPMSRHDYLLCFGCTSGDTNELTNEGLRITIGGQKFIYQSLERGFQDMVGSSFRLVFDPADMGSVLAVSNDGKQQFLVPAWKRVPMAIKDHSTESWQRLHEVLSVKKEIGQASIDRLEEARENAASLIISPEQEALMRGRWTLHGQNKMLLQGETPEKPRRKAKPKNEPAPVDLPVPASVAKMYDPEWLEKKALSGW